MSMLENDQCVWVRRVRSVYPLLLQVVKRMAFGRVACMALLAAAAGSARAASLAQPSLLLDGREISAASTLEVRFPAEMVAAKDLGVPQENSPVRVTPSLRGKFVWLSPRSGVFVPDQAPEMGVKYLVTARPGLKDASGKPVDPSWKGGFNTPAFRMVGESPSGDISEDIPAMPNVRLSFNRNIDAERVSAFLRFVDGRGRTVAALARHPLEREFFLSTPGEGDWDAAWRAVAQAQGGAPMPAPNGGRGNDEAWDSDLEDSDAQTPNSPVRHRLVVWPREPLPPGGDWRLELKAGFPSVRPGSALPKTQSLVLGRVRPFVVAGVQSSGFLNGGRSVCVKFSHFLASDVTRDSARRFLRVFPEPPGAEYELDIKQVTIRGDFKRGETYRLDVDPSLLSDGGAFIGGALSHSVRFEAFEPRVYLPGIDTHQVASGGRKFPVWSVNMKALRVRAVLVEPARVVGAREAFGNYQEPVFSEPAPGRQQVMQARYQRVDPESIPGRVLWEKAIPLGEAPVDSRIETVLDWDEILAGVRAGAVFLTVEGEPRAGTRAKVAGSQCLVQITDLGVIWKKEAGGLWVHVFSMADAVAVADASVQVLDEKGAELAAAVSDARGNARVEVGEKTRWLRVTRNGDSHVLVMGHRAEELPMRAFRISTDYSDWSSPGREDSVRGLVFTDRPLYRRSETVHVKGIVRGMEAGGPVVPAGISFQMQVGGGTPYSRRIIPVKLDERGAFSADIPLGPQHYGSYSAILQIEGQEERMPYLGIATNFVVADFQPEAFEVRLDSDSRYAPDQAPVFSLNGKYYFGSPLERAQARWTLQMGNQSFSPPGFDEFTFLDSRVLEKKLFLSGTASLAAGGSARIEPAVPEGNVERMRGYFSADVTDVNQQTVTRRVSFVRDASDFYLGIQAPEEGVIAAGAPFKVHAVAVSAEGVPYRDKVSVRYEFFRVRHETVRLLGAGKAVGFKTDDFEDLLESRELEADVPQQRSGQWRAPEEGGVEFVPQQAGSYRIRVSARDAHGRPVRSAVDLLVSGKDRVAWSYRNPAQVDLVASRNEYAPGEVARIAMKTPFSGEALVSVERGDRILRSWSVRMEGSSPVMDVPLEAGDAPNVVVQVVLLRGARHSTRQIKAPEYRYGACELRVRDPATRLRVDVTASKPRVQPGEAVESVVEVRDAAGHPVPGARVTFYAVDDGILALRGFERPDPNLVFERGFSLGVRTGCTLYELFPEDPGELTLSNKGYLIGGGGGGVGALKLRTQFPGTLAWMPDLTTDAAGRVRVSLKAPDALTRYRLVAVAHAGTNRFGSGESAFEIHKPFSLLSAVGQFAHVGDRLTVRAVVRNDFEESGWARVRLDLDERAEPAGGSLEREIELHSGESRELDFAVRIKGEGAARWVFSGSLSADRKIFSDGLEIPVQIHSPAARVREFYAREILQPEASLLEGVNPQMMEGTGSVEVTLSNTRLSGLRDGAEWLLKYPYGCAEQQISALVPWVALADLAPVLPGFESDESLRQKQVEQSLAKLLSQQLPEGGIGYWPGGKTASFFASAYAVWALEPVLKRYNEGQNLRRLVEFLQEQLRSRKSPPGELGPDLQAFALAALASADSAQHAYQELLWERRTELSLEGRAFLACALLKSGGDRRMAAELLQSKGSERAHEISFGSALRIRMVQLIARSLLNPRDPELEILVREILQGRSAGRWSTTQENGWAILALASYFRSVEKQVPEVDAVLRRGSGGLAAEHAVKLDARNLARVISEVFGPANPMGALGVQRFAGERLYAQTRFEVQTAVAVQPRQARGFSVSRSYWKENSGGVWEGARDLQVGDRVLVCLRVESDAPAMWVAVDDPVPAILEPLNPDFRTDDSALKMRPTRLWFPSHREVRADRVCFFCDELPAGHFSFQYLARVRMAGKALAPQTKVEEMYRPERFGLGTAETLEARPR